MCGIVGILGKEAVAFDIVEGLKRLEYRGYDSAGVAVLDGGEIIRVRAEGKLKNLEGKLREKPLSGRIGIGHTRWATHGKPTENNAHPHATERLAVVHNGIIENFRELREELQAEGRVFASETDTEVVAHLVTSLMDKQMSAEEAVAAALPRLHGAFALGFVFKGEDNLLIGARRGAPLAVGHGDGEMYLGSDALALAPFTDTITYLEDGDWVVLDRGSARYFNEKNQPVKRKSQKTQAGAFLVDKGNHRHFMAKEIHEQPEVIGRTLAHYIDMGTGEVRLPFNLPFDWAKVGRLSISACGTAYLAGQIGKYWFERLARLPVEIDIASEFRYREAPMTPGDVMLVISQSGETADTLAALRYGKDQKQHILSVVNVPTSTIARESHVVAGTLAGPEIGVASTKAFTCQLTVLACLAIAAGRARGVLSAAREKELVTQLIAIPGLVAEALKHEAPIEALARELSKATDVLYLGRGTSFPARHGRRAEAQGNQLHPRRGLCGGELKHGPIALIDETMPVIVMAPRDHWFEKTVSNVQEVAARGGAIVLIGPEGVGREVAWKRWRKSPCPTWRRISRPSSMRCPPSSSPITRRW